jgi:hypothetical protein
MPGGVESAHPAAAAHLVILSSSHYFHNYRHTANALAVYHAAREAGVPDERIVLMLAGDHACDPRNAAPASVRHTSGGRLELNPCDARVDYRGDEVSVSSFLRVLTGRVPPGASASRRLLSDWRSDVVVYMTGHGGDGFFKFRDLEELGAAELAAALAQMQAQRRAARLLVFLDTCQAETMAELFSTSGVVGAISVAASRRGEPSLSRQVDPGLGVAVADRFTFQLHAFLTAWHAETAVGVGHASPSAPSRSPQPISLLQGASPPPLPPPPGSHSLGRLVASLSRSRIVSTVVVSQHGWGQTPGQTDTGGWQTRACTDTAPRAWLSIPGGGASILADGASVLGDWSLLLVSGSSAWVASIFGAAEWSPPTNGAVSPLASQALPTGNAAATAEPKVDDLDLWPFFSAAREDGLVIEGLDRPLTPPTPPTASAIEGLDTPSHPTPPTPSATTSPAPSASAASPRLSQSGTCSISGPVPLSASAAWAASPSDTDAKTETIDDDLNEWRRASVAALHPSLTRLSDEWSAWSGAGEGAGARGSGGAGASDGRFGWGEAGDGPIAPVSLLADLHAHAAGGWLVSSDGAAVLVGVLAAAPLIALVFGVRVWDRRGSKGG